MGFLILGIGIMTVIGTYQLDTQFVRKPDQLVSDYLLFPDPMVLDLKIIVIPKQFPIS